MTSRKYKALLFVWKINPLKKTTLDLLKKIKFIRNSKIVTDLYLNSKFKVTLDDIDFQLYNVQYDKSSFDIYLFGIEKSWDRTSLKIWKDLSRHSTTIFDVGTNIGLYSLTAKSSNPNAQVIGFEPSNGSYQKMEKNRQINGYEIILEKLALSNENGTVTFYDSLNHTAVSSLKLNDNLRNEALISYDVSVSTFDEYVRANNIPTVDLVSIDVEENEENVLLGMTNILAKDKPTILIEILRGELGERIQLILDGYGYQYYFVNEDGFLKPTTKLKDRSCDFIHSFNVLAISQEKLNDFVISKWIK